MSISQNPLTGGMKNSMANFITTRCGDKNVIRAKAFSPRDANSSSQRIQRASMKLIVVEHQSLGGITDIGFPAKKSGTSAYNLFVRANVPGALDKTGELPVIDYSKLVVAEGSLPPIEVVSAIVSASGIRVSYETDTEIPNVKGTDEVVAFVKTTTGKVIISRQPRGVTATGTILISHSGLNAENVVGCYLFVLSMDGKKASKSVYTVIG